VPHDARFLYIARGSLSEVETQIMVANRLGYVAELNEVQGKIDQTFAHLGGLLKHLESKR
jgi:four helix bundle protein